MEEKIDYCEKDNLVRVTFLGEFHGPSTTIARQQKVGKILDQHSCKRVLFDFRQAKVADSIIETHSVASEGNKLGFDWLTKMAILFSGDLKKLKYFEIMMTQMGYTVKAFTNEAEALNWLKD